MRGVKRQQDSHFPPLREEAFERALVAPGERRCVGERGPQHVHIRGEPDSKACAGNQHVPNGEQRAISLEKHPGDENHKEEDARVLVCHGEPGDECAEVRTLWGGLNGEADEEVNEQAREQVVETETEEE